jgi:hypothetical protein
MKLGEVVVYAGKLCILRGVDPASVFPRCVALEDAQTHERFWVAIEELERESAEERSPF